jgi:hypothetical protein
VLVLELGPCTAAMLHLFAHMDTTVMRRMAARRTGITAQAGLLVEFLLEQDPGFTVMAAIGAVAVIMAVADTTDVVAMLVADR